MANDTKKIKSIQLTKSFYFGVKLFDRLIDGNGGCELSNGQGCILVVINGARYEVPKALAVVEYVQL